MTVCVVSDQNQQINDITLRYIEDLLPSISFHSLSLWRPLLPYEYSYKASCEHQSAQMSKNWHMDTCTVTLSVRVP